jgi:putative serine esterase DUF676
MRRVCALWCMVWLRRVALASLCIAGLCSACFASTCDPARLPDAGHNVWYCANDSDTVVVFVHGLHSDNVTAWKGLAPQDADSASYWPSLVLIDANLRQPSVYLAGFYTEIGGTEYGMNDAANELYSVLATPSGTQPPVLSKRNILFVAHSLGGIIVRDVLVRHTQAFTGKRVGLLLVASPSGGSHYATALATTASVTRQRLVQELAIGSPFLQRLDDDFRQLLYDQRIPGLVGSELVENQFVDLGAGTSGLFGKLASQFGWALAKVYGTRIVEQESAARYFPRPVTIPKSDHFTISRPSGLNDYAHRELVLLFNRMQAAAAPSCESPAGFRLVLDVSSKVRETLPADISEELKASLPLLRLWRTKPDGTFIAGLSDDARRDPATTRHQFSPSAPFPCPGDSFRAKLRPIPITSYMDARVPEFADLCFRRSVTRTAERSAFLRCTHPGDCQPDAQAPGLAEPCMKTGWRWPELVTTAHAQEQREAAPFWAAPSLATLISLPADHRPGYAEFTVRSSAIAGITGANGVSFQLAVNGVPIYFDGVPPHTEVLPFNSADGVRLTFGVENLGFTGGGDGYERLELEVRYWKDQTMLKEAKLRRTYVSYRHARPERIVEVSGDTYEWAGYYRPAKVQNRYEVIVAVAQKAENIARLKREFDARKSKYDGKLVLGVIRPPREDNPVYGLTLGLKLESQQVTASFAEKQARALCRWLANNASAPKWIRTNSYLYEFPPEVITDSADRGRMRAHCRLI